ncbi:MAG: hypothetical protein CMB84_03415 [Flammeovirgaceae bacterium]|nr:hypothetical protein [Flammeovirgaceae bacterium]|tara:strand:+ start:231 stop:752 length:522 start_codon:yes stop_codon:yes gene_type:complete
MNPRYIFFSFVFSFFSCQDKCDKYTTYVKSTPKYLKMESLRDSVYFDIEREINSPGKLNYKDGYLFISEVAKGVHVIDNRNVNNPIKIGFINIPGNYDIATKDNFLYADSYIDLVILDISNVNEIKEVNRVEGSFQNYYENRFLFSETLGIVTGYEEQVIEEFEENKDCELVY